ncbi:hypothetical protein EON82_07575 [bacterium]|nr:MAG: hypothetical protein EON82_07575 [bacterium]
MNRFNLSRRNALTALVLVACLGCAGEGGGGGTGEGESELPEISVRYVNNSTHEAVYMDAGSTITPEPATLVSQGGFRTENVQFSVPSDGSSREFSFAVSHDGGAVATGTLNMNRAEANNTNRITVTWNGATVTVTRATG